jgi:predicted nucleic acid-binding protein
MLVLDANILIRAVLGLRVRTLLASYGTVEFFSPDTAYEEARKHLPEILTKRGIAPQAALALLDSLAEVIQPVQRDTYESFEDAARRRLASRDLDDWPVLATALALGCPIWTEDRDFFGTGVATWTTDRVELFLKEAEPAE